MNEIIKLDVAFNFPIEELVKDKDIVKQLEMLSDKIRKGIPVDIYDSICVIQYQQYLIEQKRKNNIWNRIKCLFKKMMRTKCH